MISDKGTLIFLHYNDGIHRTVTNLLSKKHLLF